MGAGYLISPETGEISTYVKLTRVALLIPVVAMFVFAFRESHRAAQHESKSPPILPLFLVSFVALVALNSAQLIPQPIMNGFNELSRWCLVSAIAALGIKTSFKKLAAVGLKPIILMVSETVFLAVFALIAIELFL